MRPSFEAIQKVFSEVLETDCGLDDNFFDLGGDSLSAERLVTEVSDAFGLDLPISVLLDYPTPRELAEFLDASNQG